MIERKRARVWLGAALLASAGVIALAGDTTTRAVFRANSDGTGVEQMIPSNVAEGRGALTADQQYVYWEGGFGVQGGSWIRRSDLDGSNLHEILGPGGFGGIAVDTQNSKLYFTRTSDCIPECGSIARSNLDGSDFELLFPAGFPGAIAVVTEGDLVLVCWSDGAFGADDPLVPGIVCSILDSQGIVFDPYVEVNETAAGLAIDSLDFRLYWTASDRIRRKIFSGGGIEDLVLGLDSPSGIVLDPLGDQMWWTEPGLGKIQRAHLDGSNVQDIGTGLDSLEGIGFVRAPAAGPNDKIYWVSAEPPEEVPASSAGGLVSLTLLLLTASYILFGRSAIGAMQSSRG
jgi:low density lipoprotein receptor-related protein 5/6